MNILPIFIPHLGCPNDCVFCNQREIASPYVPTESDVKKIIENGLEYSNNPQIAYYGGSFTAIERDKMIGYLSCAYEYVKAGLCCGIRVSTRPDGISREILDILREYGVDTIELGAQSMCDDVLCAAKRGHSAQNVRDACALIKENGFKLGLQIMAGLPLDNDEKSLYSAQEMVKEKPDFVRIYPVCVIEHTCLAKMWENGTYQPLSVDKAVEICAKMCITFENAHIKVIRIGLNPTDELSNGGVLGGAYHPALGEMVRSKVMNTRIREELSLIKENKVAININPKDMSVLRGQKNKEFKALLLDFPQKAISICENLQIERGNFMIAIAKQE